MIGLLKYLVKYLPWLLLVLALVYIAFFAPKSGKGPIREVNHQTLLQEVEALGKLELVRYNFKDVIEMKEISKEFDLKVFKFKGGPDARAILISSGEAVGCIDLTKISLDDMEEQGDTLFIRLPDPELCYYKVNLGETTLYTLETGFLYGQERKDFINRTYRYAEDRMREAALESGILDQTKENAHRILQPMLTRIAGREVQLYFSLEPKKLDRPDL